MKSRRGEPGEGPTITPRDFLVLLVRYKWLIVGVSALVTLPVAFWTLQQPKIYRATCTIEYDPNPTRPLGNEIQDVADPVGSYWQTREYLDTQNEVITSRGVLERVVRTLSLHQDPSFFFVEQKNRATWQPATVEAAAILLQSRVDVEPRDKTQLVDVSVEDQDPERARTLAEAVANAYIEKTIEDRSQSSVTAIEWLGTHLDQLRHQLDASELALHAFKEDHNVLSVSMEERQNLVAGSIETFNGALSEARLVRVRLQARLGQLRAANQNDPVEVHATVLDMNQTLSRLREEYRTKNAEMDSLRTRYGDAHPTIQGLSAELDRIRNEMRREIDGLIRSAELDLEEARNIETGIRSAVNDANHEGLELNLREIEYNRLNRERQNHEKLHEMLLQRTTEADLAGAMRVTHARILEAPVLPTTPVQPRVSMNIAAGAFAGLFLAFIAAFVVSRLDRRVRTIEQVESFGLTVLGALPLADEEKAPGAEKKTRSRRRGKDDPAASPADLIVHHKPMSFVAEACRSIRTNVLFMGADLGLRRVAVTSAGPEEGKTFVTLSLAISFAQSGKRVLVVDTDLRRPRIHKGLGLTNKIGVTSRILGGPRLEDLIHQTEVPNLWALTSGPIPPNPSELLHSSAFRDLMDDVSQRYDMVLFDTPPVGVLTDAAVLAPQVDGVILVMRANRTTLDGLGAAVRQLRDVGARILGGVLNGVDTSRVGYYAGGTYYYKRGYYTQDEQDDVAAAAEE